VKLISYFQLFPRSRIRGSIHSLSSESSLRSEELLKHKDKCIIYMDMQVIMRNVVPKVEVSLKQGCTMSQCRVFQMGPNLFSAILWMI
jgi:hypothetical protein